MLLPPPAKNRLRTCFKNRSQRHWLPRIEEAAHNCARSSSWRPKKRMRVSTPSFTATAPVFLPDDSIPEANDDMGGFSCSMEELLGLQVNETLRVGATVNICPLEAHENIEHSHYSEPDEEQQFLLNEVAAEHEPRSVHEASGGRGGFGKDGEAHGLILKAARMMEADPIEVSGAKTGVEMDQQEPLYLDCLDQVMLEDMLEDRAMHNPAFRDAQKEERYNAAPDLDVPSLQGHDHLFKFPPGFFDAFEAAWKARRSRAR
ncbi:hypothetical protein ZWY2020_040853 [Hordeum vulgare]|nr:hypothetical protein ZWY2020_040853 [Hordeum vulgare]